MRPGLRSRPCCVALDEHVHLRSSTVPARLGFFLVSLSYLASGTLRSQIPKTFFSIAHTQSLTMRFTDIFVVAILGCTRFVLLDCKSFSGKGGLTIISTNALADVPRVHDSGLVAIRQLPTGDVPKVSLEEASSNGKRKRERPGVSNFDGS
jgi:hypothetical protein